MICGKIPTMALRGKNSNNGGPCGKVPQMQNRSSMIIGKIPTMSLFIIGEIPTIKSYLWRNSNNGPVKL